MLRMTSRERKGYPTRGARSSSESGAGRWILPSRSASTRSCGPGGRGTAAGRDAGDERGEESVEAVVVGEATRAGVLGEEQPAGGPLLGAGENLRESP